MKLKLHGILSLGSLEVTLALFSFSWDSWSLALPHEFRFLERAVGVRISDHHIYPD